PPGQLLLLRHFLELLGPEAANVDADQREGLVLQLLDERPLVGPLGPSRQSDKAPEVEQHHLSTMVAKLEALAVLVFPLYVRRLVADAQVADSEQFCLREFRNRAAVGKLLVAVLLRGVLKDRFDLLQGLVAILALQLREVRFAEEPRELLGQSRLFAAQIDP